jgi:acetyl esterase/lipase
VRRPGVARAHDTPGAPAPSRVFYDVVYGSGGGVDLKLDLYYSTAPFDPAPVIIYIHGGGFVNGDKADVTSYAEFGELLARGYAIAALGYRLGLPFPAAVEDVKAGVRYLRGNASRLGLAPERIGAWGVSAGGNLAAMLGVMGPGDGFEGTGGSPGASSRVQAVADMFGPNDFSLATNFGGSDVYLPVGADRVKASPIAYVTPGDAPFLLMHGERDTVVPPVHSTAMHRALLNAGVPSELVLVRNAGHGFGGRTASPNEEELAHMAGDFFDRNVKSVEQQSWAPPP